MKAILRMAAALMMFAGIAGLAQAQVYVSASVNQPAQLVADAGNDPAAICPGDTVDIGGNPSANGGDGTYNYAWAPTGSLVSGTVANPLAFPSTTTSYVLTVTDGNNCTSIDTIVVEVTVCVGIEDPNAGYAVSVFPNPATTEFKVRVEGMQKAAEASLDIFDITGKNVYSRNLGTLTGEYETAISTTQFSKGSYLVRLTIGGEQFSRNLIIR